MSELSCSKVADKEVHKPHTYFYGGYDVRCNGYSPMREALSDEAETPREFYGLDQTKALADNRRVPHAMLQDDEIEELLFDEKVIDAQSRYGGDILREYMKGSSLLDVAEKFNLSVGVVVGVLGDDLMHNFPPHVRYDINYPEPEDYTKFDQFVDWWERLSTSMQDFILLVLIVAIVTLVALVFGVIF
jgi:hypothetical protein